MIPFGEWLPDQAVFSNPGTSNVNNVLPGPNSYRPLGSVQPISDALASAPIGGSTAQTVEGVVVNLVGTTTALYKLQESTFQDITRASGAYTTTEDERWAFAQFGDMVIATNFSDAPQMLDLTLANQFADLGGSPPKARHIAVVRDFVVLGNLNGNRNGVHWSAFNDAEGWTIGTDQSDRQIFPEGGWVQGILGGEQGTIFLERAIIRMTATGDDYVFQFDVVERGRGLFAPGSLVQIGQSAFFLAHDGFYLFDGSRSHPIGVHKVDKTFFTDANEVFLGRMSGVADPINKLVIWSYASTESVTGDPDRLIMYNWVTQQWSRADLGARLLLPILTPGTTLESLDSYSASLDALDIPLDSRLWSEGSPALGVMDLNDKLGMLTGPALEATLETKEAEIVPGGRTFIREVRPVVDADSIYVSLGGRERFSQDPTYTDEAAMTETGRCTLRSSARYHRARVRIPAGSSWTHAQGVDFVGAEDGRR